MINAYSSLPRTRYYEDAYIIFGLTKVVGGVEFYIRNLIYNIDREKYYFDFVIVCEEEKACCKDEFNELSDNGKAHFYHRPNMNKGFISINRWFLL